MTQPHYQDDSVTLWHGDALEVLRGLPDGSVDCCVTSPPYYGLRSYLDSDHPDKGSELGAEASPAEYVAALVAVFAEVRRVLADDGTLWLNLGDSYSSGARTSYASTGKAGGRIGSARPPSALPDKNLLGIPWRVAFALQDDGWILRNDVIWAKPNGMPESVVDRLSTKHEHVFMLAKSRRYWFDLDPIREPHVAPPQGGLFRRGDDSYVTRATGTKQGKWDGEYSANGRNPGDVWSIPTQPFPGAHFATMPSALAERCILAGCKPGGTVLDPFSGSGTTGLAATKHGRRYVGIDLNADYLDLSLRTRLAQGVLIDDGGAA